MQKIVKTFKFLSLLFFSMLLISTLTIGCAKDPIYEPCSQCNGTGVCPMCHGKKQWCEYCHGTGKCPACKGSGHSLERKWCPVCGTELKYSATKCPKCGAKIKYDHLDEKKF